MAGAVVGGALRVPSTDGVAPREKREPRSEPGPRPAPFDPSSFAAERAGLLACFDETKAMRARGETDSPVAAM